MNHFIDFNETLDFNLNSYEDLQLGLGYLAIWYKFEDSFDGVIPLTTLLLKLLALGSFRNF